MQSLTLARVGDRAGYSRGLITHCFRFKQALPQRLTHAPDFSVLRSAQGIGRRLLTSRLGRLTEPVPASSA
jgi:AcrR family transcriptional regulator